jgi:homopolymeric O-antigen transport system ATP-binding protein
MSDVAVEFDHVWKKFRKGEIHDSLRDLIPALTRTLFYGNHKQDLQAQEFWALKDVSFQVKRGEACGIIGPNGAGKSTILKLLSRILESSKGQMHVNGKLSALIEVGAGFHPDLTGRENIYLNGTILGMKRQEIDRKLDEIIAFSGIEDFIDTPVKRYSSGMHARLGFSVAAHIDPDILLIDEVLSVGDFPFQTKCIKKMRDAVTKGVTVIFISHNIPSVIQLCPRAILMKKGEILKSGPSESVCRFYHHAFAEMHRAKTSIELKDFEVQDKEGAPCNAFQVGDWATARIVVTSSEDLDGLIMGFLIKRMDGVVVFDCHSNAVADRYFSLKAGETKEITIHFRTNLPQGTYFLGAHMLTPKSGFHLYNDEALQFHVIGPKTLGQAFVDTKWE